MTRVTALLSYLLSPHNKTIRGNSFVSRLISEVIRDRKEYAPYRILDEARKRYSRSKEKIRVRDMGAGSKKIKHQKFREVRDIVRISAGRPASHRLLYRMISYYKPSVILEAGTSLGLGTLALALGNPEGRVFTVEGDPASARLARQLFEQQRLTNITLLNGTFREMFPQVFQQTHRLDLVFLDGHHQEKPTLEYFGAFLPRLHEKSILVMDDIYWSRGMFKAWNAVRHHPSVSLSIDLFRMGILFFDPELPKQTLKLRL